jgi:hypothetical protein
LARLRVPLTAHHIGRATDRIGRELRRIVLDADSPTLAPARPPKAFAYFDVRHGHK